MYGLAHSITHMYLAAVVNSSSLPYNTGRSSKKQMHCIILIVDNCKSTFICNNFICHLADINCFSQPSLIYNLDVITCTSIGQRLVPTKKYLKWWCSHECLFPVHELQLVYSIWHSFYHAYWMDFNLQGVIEMEDTYGMDDKISERIQYFLDRFYMNRISIRMLLTQHGR